MDCFYFLFKVDWVGIMVDWGLVIGFVQGGGFLIQQGEVFFQDLFFIGVVYGVFEC